MTGALERSMDPDPAVRHQAALDLREEPGAQAAARLVALLADDAEVCTDEGMSIYDVEPTYAPVSAAARASLPSMGAHLWPAIADAWSAASPSVRGAMIAALRAQPLAWRARLPDDAHARLEDAARETGIAPAIAEATWERAFAARVRGGALEDPEAFWRAAHDHPNPVERDRSLVFLAGVVTDPVDLARTLLAMLDEKGVWHSHVVAALLRLPPVLPSSLVERAAASDAVRARPELWVWLARHGDAARALIPACLDALRPSMIGAQPNWIPTTLDDKRWRLATEALRAFGPLSADARALLLDRLATVNESMSLQGSLRRWLCELLGDVAAIERELAPRLEQMASSADPVAVERARQLRHRFAVMRGA